MKRIVLLVVLASVSVISRAQNIVFDENAEIRSVTRFTGVEVSGTISLYLSQGDTEGMAVSAGDASYNKKIKTEVKNGILHISVDGGMWNGFNWANRKLKAYVTVTNLDRVEASGATYVNLTGTIKSDQLKIDISGASEIKGDLDVNKLAIEVSGASVVRLTGKAQSAFIEASGACMVNGYKLYIDSCKASSSGASGIRVFVKDHLIADASGGASIYYKGTPVSTNLNSSAGSNIKNKSGDD